MIDLIVERCSEIKRGGRVTDVILTYTVLPKVSNEILSRMMEGQAIDKVHVKVVDGEFGNEFE